MITAGRGDRELLRGRPRRRLHRLRQAHVPLRGEARTARRRSSGRRGYQNSGDRQAEPGRRRLGDDADDHERRLRGDHRQRRADERRRLPDARKHLRRGQRRVRLRGARSSATKTGATENSLITAGRSLIVENNYGYQDPFGAEQRRRHRARLRPRRRQGRRQRLPQGLDQHATPAPRRVVPKLSTTHRPDLHLHAAARPERRPGLLLDRDRLPQRQDRLEPLRRLRAPLQQQLRRPRPRPRRDRIPRCDRRASISLRDGALSAASHRRANIRRACRRPPAGR